MIELRCGEVLLRVDPSDGGRIVSLAIVGRERIVPKARARAISPAIYWGCYPMVPWPGRLGGGRIPSGDGDVWLEPNLPPWAIHGLGFAKAWTVLEQSGASITLACNLRGLGWPFGGWARQSLRLDAASLALELEVGGYSRAGPAGLGWHPWFTRPETGDLELELDASEVLVLDADQLPTGEIRHVTADEDLRTGPPLGDRRLDHIYVGTKGPAIVRWPDLELRVEYGDDLETVVVHTPREGICVEPQTMWPNAPVLAAAGVPGTGLRILEPGGHLRVAERWSWRSRGAGDVSRAAAPAPGS